MAYEINEPRATPSAIAGLKAPASVKAALLVLLCVRGGTVLVTLPDGRALLFGDLGPRTTLDIKNYRFARRLIANGDIGFAEGWIAGDWESDDLSALLALLAANTERISLMFFGSPLGRLLNRLRHRRNSNSKRGARRNILAHYDLGNSFYQAWLDRSMTYSAAKFDADAPDLETAQLAKYRALAEQLELKPGEHVLEIGCGWGGFAEFAAREYGVRVTGLTISDEQLAYARNRIAGAGLAEQVDIRRLDYRDIDGRFDKIASIEMFEAVGEKYWPAFFAKLSEALKPGGRAALQIITIQPHLFEDYRNRADFIQRYIFPGGMLASVERLRHESSRANLTWAGCEAFGQSYAQTLREWARRFQSNWAEIRRLGFDERFKRLWLFYLGYCEAGFASGRTDVVQIALCKSGSCISSAVSIR